MGRHEKFDGKTRVARHRAAMRAKGLRLKLFWVPDVRSPGFQALAAEEAQAIAGSPHEVTDQAFVDAVGIWDEWPSHEGAPGNQSEA